MLIFDQIPYLTLKDLPWFIGGHGLAHQSNVGVVPRVIVDQRRPIGHTSNLIPIIPPWHDRGIFSSILPKPIIGFTEIVKDVATTKIKYGWLLSSK